MYEFSFTVLAHCTLYRTVQSTSLSIKYIYSMYILYIGQYIQYVYIIQRSVYCTKILCAERDTEVTPERGRNLFPWKRKRERKREKEDLFIQEPDQYMQVVPLSFCRKVFIQSFDMTYIHSVEKSLFIRKDWLLFILQKSLYSLILHDFHSFCRN